MSSRTARQILVVLSLGILFAARDAHAQMCVPAPIGLAHWWPGDGDASDIQGGLNGTLVSGASVSSGLVRYAFNLDGVDDVVVTPTLGMTSATVDMWIYPGRVDGDTRLFSQMSGATSQAGAIAFEPTGPGNPGSLWVWSQGWRRLSPNNTVSANTWSHLAFVYTGGAVTLFVNGVQVGSAPSAFDFSVSALGIGAPFLMTFGRSFSGLIDEFAVFNRPLTAAEIQSMHLAGSAGTCRLSLYWREVSTTTAPADRAGHKMVYDSVNRKVLLFGGQSPTGALFNDIWEFDTRAETWSDVTPVGTPMPSPRSRFGMAFDTARNVVMIYGGYVGGSPGTNDETWEWNPVVRRWTFRGNAGVIDFAGRTGTELAFDPNLNQVILFGGVPYWDCPSPTGTYGWNGAAWSQVGGGPIPGRVYHSLATDFGRSRVVLYGGGSYDCSVITDHSDTWEWDGASWTQVTVSPNRPSTNRGVALAFDSVRQEMVSFGGSVTNQSWLWDGAAWTLHPSVSPPSARMSPWVFDPLVDKFVVFGGSVGGNPNVRNGGVGGGVGGTWVSTRRAASTLTVDDPAVGVYRATVEVIARLLSNLSEPLPGRTVRLLVNSIEHTGITDADGVARATVDLGGVPAGVHTLTAIFDGDASFEPATGTTTITVSKVVPAVGWATPAPIAYGTPLSSTQLNAQAEIPGTFTYTPAVGTILTGGTHELQGLFTPTDVANYESRSVSVSLVVNLAVPLLTWPAPAPMLYGTPLGDGQLNAVANVSGTLVYSPGPGSVLNVGAHTLSVAFTPTDTMNVATGATATATLEVVPAMPNLTMSSVAPTYDGTPHSVAVAATGSFGEPLGPIAVFYRLLDTGSAQGGNGKGEAAPAAEAEHSVQPYAGPPDASWSSTPPVDAGGYEVHVDYFGSLNYLPATRLGSLTIKRAVPTVTVTGSVNVYDGLPHAASAFVTGVAGEELGSATVQYDGNIAVPVDAGTFDASATYAGSRNYQQAVGRAALVITPATATLAVTGGQFVYDGQLHPGVATATGVLGEQLEPVALEYSGGSVPLDAGTYVVSASFAGTGNYQPTFATADISIARAAATVAVTGGTFGYNGQPHAAVAVATGVFGEGLGSVAIEYNGAAAVPSGAGTYVVAAAFAGNGNYLPASGTASLVIEPGAPTIAVMGGVFDYDGSSHAASGTVADINGTSLGALAFTYNGSSTPPVNAGVYEVIGRFAGTANYSAGTATTLLRIVAVPLRVSAVDTSKVYGQPNPVFGVTYATFVGTDTPATLGGSLEFATTAAATSPAGGYVVTPSGLSSTNYVLEYVPGTITIAKAASLVTLTSSANPVSYQTSFALTAQIAHNPAGAGVTTGTVAFLHADGIHSWSADVTAGQATVNITLDPGAHLISAHYSGDGNITAGVSVPLSVTVSPRNESSTTTLKTKTSTSSFGEEVTFQVDVSSPGGSPTGHAQLFDGDVLLGVATLLTNGGATIKVTMPIGAHTIVARYLPDAGIPPSVSAPVVHTVTNGTPLQRTTTKVSLSPNNVISIEDVEIEIKVSSPGSVPGGSVFMSVDGGPPNQLTLTTVRGDGVVTATRRLSIGSHIVTAVYPGSTTHAGSSIEIAVDVKK